MSYGSNAEAVEEVRQRTDIVEIIGARVSLKRSGHGYVACCPFHREKTPSFHVNPSRQSFKCFGCGEGGDVYSFLMKHDGMTFPDALRMLADRCGVTLRFEKDDGQGLLRKRLLALHATLAGHYRRCLLDLPEAEAARRYLRARALDGPAAQSFQIGYAPRADDALLRFSQQHGYTLEEMLAGGLLSATERAGRSGVYDRFRGRLMFPIADTQGRVIAFSARLLEDNKRLAKYVNSPETPIFQKSRVLYALDKAQRAIVAAPNRQALLCEGQIDVIRCHLHGFGTAVAAQGTAFTEDHVALLRRYADSAVIAFDSDTAGRTAAVRTAGLLLAAGIPARVVDLPDGADPDTILRDAGPEAFRERLGQAEEIVPFQVRLLRAAEASPDSADALGRISNGVLQTVARSANAVHRARMLQETAALLNVPEAALAEELARIQEQERQQAARREQRAAVRQGAYGTTPRGSPAGTAGGAERKARSDERPLEDWAPVDSADSDFGEEGATRGPAETAPSPEEYALCELLLHHGEDVALMRFVEAHVPLALIEHPLARAVVEAVFRTIGDTDDHVLRLQERDPESAGRFVGRLAVAPMRLTGDEYSEMDVARDLVLALWRRRWKSERERLLRESDPATHRDQERQRLTLTVELTALRHWDRGVHVIQRERQRLDALSADAPPGPGPAAREPASERGYAGVSDGAVDDPDGTPGFDDDLTPLADELAALDDESLAGSV